ncbi:MAG: YbgC/FadM family acyl-CoA thioesterase [Alphaproteobacteria bacterium]|jgi:acyl-CoA thioester hydrolase|nr:YbgC/FadM family acyl-CoA thioesterase [Alphaproteobacteria bacterium]
MTGVKGLGHFDGKTHILPIAVYYEDTDLSGVVYHANYLRYMERGRTEFFRLAGISRANLNDAEPSAWAIRRIAVEYHRPARLDDQIAVHSVLTAVTGARMNVVQKIFCGQVLLVEGRIEACMITLTGKLQRLPKNVLETLAPYVTTAET